ncbi:carboxylesterase 5A-like [Trichogramma pretiosum]|uniref:carboxylesterase 5A-like n=1 Tax=Trichogramma pretiosum TaxID=7493 RepID=UPI000C71C75E|nr:carboxylesterase 5A-like [Trichogramma pretiosum]
MLTIGRFLRSTASSYLKKPIESKRALTVIVKTEDGKIKGHALKNVDKDVEYFSLRGIPYAEPPINDLRFKDPIPKKKWTTNIRDTVDESNMSLQYEPLIGKVKGKEDCLYLDIATSEMHNCNKPVMVWFHGGAFKMSSNTPKIFGPDYLIKHNIVFVSINYRLGLMGFLNMDHEECCGNMGLKDQILALKWIQQNIQYFGGDSNNVTVFGQSAGGASIHALCLSSEAKGLFHKAIIQSGALTNPWAHIKSNKKWGYALANSFGHKCDTDLDVIKNLKKLPAKDLVKKYEDLCDNELAKVQLSLVPSQDAKSKNPILPGPIRELAEKGINVPLIIGYNSHEGIVRFLGDTSKMYDELDKNFNELLASHLRIDNCEKLTEFTEPIKRHYFGDDKITKVKFNEAAQFFGDLLFIMEVIGVAKIQQHKDVPTYLYKFSYRPDLPGVKEKFGIKIKGTCHGDELDFLFHAEARKKKISAGTRDRTTMERMTTMWTNFAKFGNPTPEKNELLNESWLPVTKKKLNCLNISDELTCSENNDLRTYEIWKPLLSLSQ